MKGLFIIVMATGIKNNYSYLFFFDSVNQPVFAIYSLGPATRQVVFQLFCLNGTSTRMFCQFLKSKASFFKVALSPAFIQLLNILNCIGSELQDITHPPKMVLISSFGKVSDYLSQPVRANVRYAPLQQDWQRNDRHQLKETKYKLYFCHAVQIPIRSDRQGQDTFFFVFHGTPGC